MRPLVEGLEKRKRKETEVFGHTALLSGFLKRSKGPHNFCHGLQPQPQEQYRCSQPDVSHLPVLCRICCACLCTRRVLVSSPECEFNLKQTRSLSHSCTRMYPLTKHAFHPYLLRFNPRSTIARFRTFNLTPTNVLWAVVCKY